MDIRFEMPTPDDAQTMVHVQIRAFHDDARIYPGVEMGGPPGYDSIEVLLRIMERYPCHKIVCDGRIVGGIVIIDRGEGHYHLDVLYVDPDYHNRGIGTRAMQYIEERYPASKWTLDTPLYAVRNHHFYEKMGFVKMGEEDVDGFMLINYEKIIQ